MKRKKKKKKHERGEEGAWRIKSKRRRGKRLAANAEIIRSVVSVGIARDGDSRLKGETAARRRRARRMARRTRREGAVRDENEMLWGGMGRKGGTPCPELPRGLYGAPLIFAALRFCLALSTLHTSTADRRHKTLY